MSAVVKSSMSGLLSAAEIFTYCIPFIEIPKVGVPPTFHTQSKNN